MKKTIILSLLITCLSTVLCSQNLVVTKGKTEGMSTKHYNYAAQPGDGLIIINTVIPNMEFEISNAKSRLHKTSYDKAANQYILSVQPLVEEDILGIKSQFTNGYSLSITAKGYYGLVEYGVFVENSQAVYYTIERERQRKSATVVVRDKDNKPLLNANVEYEINREKKTESTNSEGMATLRFRDDKSYTSDKIYKIKVTHQEYQDECGGIVKSGDTLMVKLYKYVPTTRRKIAFVIVKGDYGIPLSDAKVSCTINGQTKIFSSNSDGMVTLDFNGDLSYSYDKPYTLEISHQDYLNKKTITVKSYTDNSEKDIYKVTLTGYQPHKISQTSFNFWSYVVPGLGEFQADRNGEGIFVITSEVVLLGGAGVSYLLANNYKNTMNKSNVGIDEYNKALKQYNTMRGVNIACWSAAAVIYTIHIFRVASLSKKNKERHYAFMPTVMTDDQSIAYGINFGLTF